MKRLLLAGALFALTALLVSACSSPTDVSAGRKVTEEPIVSTLNVQRDLNFGAIIPNHFTTFLVEIRNTSTTKPATINSIGLKDSTKGFRLSNPPLPIALGRKGENDVVRIPVIFRGGATGEYRDELIINNDTSLTCRVVATVTIDPAVVVSDIDVGTHDVSTVGVWKCFITNQGDAPATIVSATLQGASAGDFQCELMSIPLPLVLKAGQSMEFSVQFSPSRPGQVSAIIDVEILYSGSGAVDNISVLTGNVIP